MMVVAVAMSTMVVTAPPGGAYGSWSADSSGSSADLHAVSCTQTSATVTCYAVGSGGAILRGTATISGGGVGTMTWSGEASGTTSALRGVSYSDADTCTAVGDGGTIVRRTAPEEGPPKAFAACPRRLR